MVVVFVTLRRLACATCFSFFSGCLAVYVAICFVGHWMRAFDGLCYIH